MKIKKPKKLENEEAQVFSQKQPISGGNLFETSIRLDLQNDINNSTGIFEVTDINNNINNTMTQYITKNVPNWWILLKEHANYFCNQFYFKIENTKIFNIIINTIRSAFYNGIAGIYYNDITNKYESIVISNCKYNNSGEIVSCKYTLSNVYLEGLNDNLEHGKNVEMLASIPQNKIHNLAIFKWGTEGLGCWLRIVPYVKYQHQLYTMMVTQSFSFLKKFSYVVNSQSASKEEMKAYFNPLNPFIIRAGYSAESNNRFEEINVGNTADAEELIKFYNGIMEIFYTNLGRRQNVDKKKERNITSEVEASQENYNIIFRDVFNQFKIFIDDFNVILSSNGDPNVWYENPDEKPEILEEKFSEEEEETDNEI